jgi:uncharacterized repeat protein (TIGR04138 family)
MLDPNHPISKLAREDGRYQVEAYAFVFDALNHAHTALDMGTEPPAQTTKECVADEGVPGGSEKLADPSITGLPPEGTEIGERHVSGQELCIAIRSLALEQYGYMAKCVLNRWGIHETGDFGNIVFNLITIGQMRKTDRDRREDFDNVFDFDHELVENFNITPPE